jgi:hypothetical protein
VARKFQKSHKNILALFDLILSLPAASADAERGFSELKLTKTDWRSRLRNSVLNDLLVIQFITPNVAEFDPIPSIHHWNSVGDRRRRPYFLDPDHESDAAANEDVMSEEEAAALKRVY